MATLLSHVILVQGKYLYLHRTYLVRVFASFFVTGVSKNHFYIISTIRICESIKRGALSKPFSFSTFCLTDKNSKCIGVNLYNLAPGKGVIIGDSVAIPEPFYSHVNLDIKDQVSNIKKLSGLKKLLLDFFLFAKKGNSWFEKIFLDK